MSLNRVILIILLLSLTACIKTKTEYIPSPPEIIIQKEYITDNITLPKFIDCKDIYSNVSFKAMIIDNATVYYLDTYNALSLINVETNRLMCIKNYKNYIDTICSLSNVKCKENVKYLEK